MPNAETETALGSTANGAYAKLAGVLIIVGYLTYGLPDAILIQPLVNASEPLAEISDNTTQLTLAALLMAINSGAVVGIGLLLYPIIKQHSETIALAYIGTRIFEGTLMSVGIISVLSLVPLSQEYVQASGAEASALQAVGELAVQGNFFAYSIAMIGLAVGSMPLCYLLYRTRLVPRWISVFGLIGYPVLLGMMVIDLFGAGPGPMLYALYIPGAIFELAIAVWLIVYGFNSGATVAQDSSAPAAERDA